MSGHRCQLTAFLDALDSGETPPVTLADTRNTMEFVAALYASAFTGERGEGGRDRPGQPVLRDHGRNWGPVEERPALTVS